MPRSAIQSSEDSTALLVGRAEDGSTSGICSAVWVSQIDLLTAAHCAVGLSSAADASDVVGAKLEYVTRSGYTPDDTDPKTETGIVVAVDLVNDLALVSAHDRRHGVVRLYEGSIAKGDAVFTMGHTFGLPWSYSLGVIEAERSIHHHGELVHVLQVFGGANRGDSGGGVYTVSGELVGIGAFRIDDSALLFYTHRDEVREFLKREAAL